MRGKKAKALRRFAERMAALNSLPKIEYDVIQHPSKRYRTGKQLPQADGSFIDEIINLERFQIVLKDCQRRLYQFAKQSYKRQSW